jgi:hypothetical protein
MRELLLLLLLLALLPFRISVFFFTRRLLSPRILLVVDEEGEKEVKGELDDDVVE